MTSKPAAAALKMVNVELEDAQGNMRNVIDIYRDVANNIDDLSKKEQTMVMEGLAG